MTDRGEHRGAVPGDGGELSPFRGKLAPFRGELAPFRGELAPAPSAIPHVGGASAGSTREPPAAKALHSATITRADSPWMPRELAIRGVRKLVRKASKEVAAALAGPGADQRLDLEGQDRPGEGHLLGVNEPGSAPEDHQCGLRGQDVGHGLRRQNRTAARDWPRPVRYTPRPELASLCVGGDA